MDRTPAPEILAIIPARGGSKGIKDKNLRSLAGKPLLAHSIEQARQARQVTRVVVSTDSPRIAEVAQAYGAEVVERPASISTDEASSEAALLHVLDTLAAREAYQPELIVFLQCTSPVRGEHDIDQAIETLQTAQADSLLSAVPTHRFLWRSNNGQAESVNYDWRHRPRRQDRAPEYFENGSIYITRYDVLKGTGLRLGGKVALYPMDYWAGFEIDEEEDLELCEWIIEHRRKGVRR